MSKERRNIEKLYDVIKRPIITEKSMMATALGKYTFEVQKDATKVDRSAAYMMRHIAKNIVANSYAKKCEIQIAYAIGVAHPVSVMIDTFGTGIISDDTLSEIVTETFDLRPAAIIDSLDLRRPIYRQLAAYGHMGRTDLDLPWEKTDKAVELKQAAGI